MTNHVTQSTTIMEDARHTLGNRLAAVIREGSFGLQIRFVRERETPLVWVYSWKNHEWKKRDDLAILPELANPLQAYLEGLLSQKYADAWTCHRIDHHDRTDFELKFSREPMEPHMNDNLESYILGCLSHGHHDSGQDSRRRMGFRKQ